MDSVQNLEEAAAALASGKVCLLATDTVYGLAARYDDPAGIAKIFEIKGRSFDRPLPVLVDKFSTAAELGEFGAEAIALADRYWPGGLTLVVTARAGAARLLGGEGRTIGLRVPDEPRLLRLLEKSGPLAATSANRSGDAEAVTISQAIGKLGEDVDVYLDGGRCGGVPSTVVDVTGPPRLLRAGAIDLSEAGIEMTS